MKFFFYISYETEKLSNSDMSASSTALSRAAVAKKRTAAQHKGVYIYNGGQVFPIETKVLLFLKKFLSFEELLEEGFAGLRSTVLTNIITSWPDWEQDALKAGYDNFMAMDPAEIKDFFSTMYGAMEHEEMKKEMQDIITIFNGCQPSKLGQKLAEAAQETMTTLHEAFLAAAKAEAKPTENAKERADKGPDVGVATNAGARNGLALFNPMGQHKQALYTNGELKMVPTMSGMFASMAADPADLIHNFQLEHVKNANPEMNDEETAAFFTHLNNGFKGKDRSVRCEPTTWTYNEICMLFKTKRLIVTDILQRVVIRRGPESFANQAGDSMLRAEVWKFVKGGVEYFMLIDGMTTSGNLGNLMLKGLAGVTITMEYNNKSHNVPMEYWQSMRLQDWAIGVWEGELDEVKKEINSRKEARAQPIYHMVTGDLSRMIFKSIGFWKNMPGKHILMLSTPEIYERQVGFAAENDGDMYALSKSVTQEAYSRTYPAEDIIDKNVLGRFWDLVRFYAAKTMEEPFKLELPIQMKWQFGANLLFPGLNLNIMSRDPKLAAAVQKHARQYLADSGVEEGEITFEDKTLNDEAQKMVIKRLLTAIELEDFFKDYAVTTQVYLAPIASYMWHSVQGTQSEMKHFADMIIVAKTGKTFQGVSIKQNQNMDDATAQQSIWAKDLWLEKGPASLGSFHTFDKNMWHVDYEACLAKLANTLLAIVRDKKLLSYYTGKKAGVRVCTDEGVSKRAKTSSD